LTATQSLPEPPADYISNSYRLVEAIQDYFVDTKQAAFGNMELKWSDSFCSVTFYDDFVTLNYLPNFY
jgi:hypothetical protein